ncbi:MAG: hypothetical protein CMK09_17165 [Ponticaulis sp.]|nr:hypothetical protein [Ponticaulis sp.]
MDHFSGSRPRMRIGSQVIWATHLKETKSDRRVGGKTDPKVSEYSYTISFAVALCEGEVTSVDRVWANGQPISLASLNTRLYRGTETQLADPLIEAVEGQSPAYRGLAYMVFEDFPLDDYGARLPQLSFEVTRPVSPVNSAPLGALITGVNFIPASGEWVYSPDLVRRVEYPGWEETRNRNSATGEVDVVRSLDQMQAELPNLSSLNLTLGWFGTDLRAGACEVRPGVETRDQINLPRDWSAGSTDRDTAHLISRDENDRPHYGGTPDDQSVLALLDECAARQISVTISPFLLMDIPPGNGLTDPYGGTEQAAFPWRGRITSAVDKSATARNDVEAFFGAVSRFDFALDGDAIVYSGPAEWSYRRFVLHLAMLAKRAGSVDKFLLGSELVGLTRLRDETGAFPAVEALVALAADVRALLPDIEISYAADWTEYGAYVPDDGSGDVLFPLDAFWADANCDFVGIDWYAPLSDWREGEHLDAANWDSIYDPAYLAANVEGGEGYDWYYASPEDRDAQTRTPISDGAHGEDWVFRVKDLTGWWANAHHERPLGVRSGAATAWQAEGKPIRLIEIGCGAVDKGTNAPNFFYDPKSDESGLPPYSDGTRDDAIQSAAIRALQNYWAIGGGQNPTSSVYAGPMIPEDGLSVWAWDARPFPAFPLRSDIWADGENWQLGHWLNGRLSRSDLSGLIAESCVEAGVSVDVSAVSGSLHGYAGVGLTTLAELISPLAGVFGLRCTQREDGLYFSNQPEGQIHAFEERDYALQPRGEHSKRVTRRLTDHAPRGVRLTVQDPSAEYQPASYHRGERPDGDRDLHIQLPVAVPESDANALADHLYQVTNAARYETRLTLSPERMEVLEGDLIMLSEEAEPLRVLAFDRSHTHDLTLGGVTSGFDRQFALTGAAVSPDHVPRPDLVVLDLPGLTGREDDHRPLVGANANPWPGLVTVRAGYEDGEASVRATLARSATLGRLVSALTPGPGDRMRPGLTLEVEFPEADLSDITRVELVGGQNVFAIETAEGWLVAGFEEAEQISADRWQLSSALTGIGGTEDLSALGAEVGARIVRLDAALEPAELSDHELGQTLIWQAAGPGAEADEVSSEERVHGRALTPLRPAHLKARRMVNSDLRLDWTRRARHAADRWDSPDIPLLEDSLKYQIDVVNEGESLRTEVVTEEGWTYNAADQSEDAAPATGLTFRVAQISARTGAGIVAEVSL